MPHQPSGSDAQAPPLFGEPAPAEPVAPGDCGFAKPEHAEFPPILIVAVTNVCDMACIHCAHPVIKRDPGYRATFMEPAVHTRIVEEVRDYRDRLWLFRYAADGESLLNPHFLEMVEETRAAGIGPVDLTTNAMSLGEEKMRRLLLAPVDVIDVFLDAFTKETYERIRKRGKFDVVTANLRRLLELRATGRWGDVAMCGKYLDWQQMAWEYGFENAVARVMGRDAP
jgi:MoaA/NifB/PqqE/SkfB family radical SAM enzyme